MTNVLLSSSCYRISIIRLNLFHKFFVNCIYNEEKGTPSSPDSLFFTTVKPHINSDGGHIFLESLPLISLEALNISVLMCKRVRKVGDAPEEPDPNASLDRSWQSWPWLLTQPAVVYQ